MPVKKPTKGKGNSPIVGVRVPHELYDEMRKAAKADSRTMSNYILHLLAEDLKRKREAKAGEKEAK